MASTAHAVKAAIPPGHSRGTANVRVHHIPSPALAAAIARMKRGEGTEYESVEALWRHVESLRKKKPAR